ncbi:MAG: short-subunit dehydrogenase [Candidatus Paceibacteria bacterium]|jgi:short-subunit dehydrogenase
MSASHDSPATQVATAPFLPGVPTDERRAIVIGASSGMGAAVVRQLCAEGYSVGAIARRSDKLAELAAGCEQSVKATGGAIHVRTHDVSQIAEVPELFEELVRELGGLDLVVFAAGIMPKVEPTEFDTEKDLAMLQVNLAGMIAWCNPVANYFRLQRSGTLVGISSVAGDRGRRGAPVYGTTKAAMNTYFESLRNRLSESGVHVLTIKPGFVDTQMTSGMDGLFWLISAEEAASQILKAARSGAQVRYVPRQWWCMMTIIRCIPSFVFRKLNI